jgi:hypothetical protein
MPLPVSAWPPPQYRDTFTRDEMIRYQKSMEVWRRREKRQAAKLAIEAKTKVAMAVEARDFYKPHQSSTSLLPAVVPRYTSLPPPLLPSLDAADAAYTFVASTTAGSSNADHFRFSGSTSSTIFASSPASGLAPSPFIFNAPAPAELLKLETSTQYLDEELILISDGSFWNRLDVDGVLKEEMFIEYELQLRRMQAAADEEQHALEDEAEHFEQTRFDYDRRFDDMDEERDLIFNKIRKNEALAAALAVALDELHSQRSVFLHEAAPSSRTAGSAGAPHPKPRGYAPTANGKMCTWDSEHGCWRNVYGGKHVVGRNVKRLEARDFLLFERQFAGDCEGMLRLVRRECSRVEEGRLHETVVDNTGGMVIFCVKGGLTRTFGCLSSSERPFSSDCAPHCLSAVSVRERQIHITRGCFLCLDVNCRCFCTYQYTPPLPLPICPVVECTAAYDIRPTVSGRASRLVTGSVALCVHQASFRRAWKGDVHLGSSTTSSLALDASYEADSWLRFRPWFGLQSRWIRSDGSDAERNVLLAEWSLLEFNDPVFLLRYGKHCDDSARWVFFRDAAAESTKEAGRVQEQGEMMLWVCMINHQVGDLEFLLSLDESYKQPPVVQCYIRLVEATAALFISKWGAIAAQARGIPGAIARLKAIVL